jgi:hypothetical protein
MTAHGPPALRGRMTTVLPTTPRKQGDQMCLRKNRPKCSPTDLCIVSIDTQVTWSVEKSNPPNCATSVLFKNCLK